MVRMRIIILVLALFSSVKAEIGEPDHKVPLFLSFVFPGGGQIYNGRYVKALAYAAIEGVMIYGAWKQNERMDQAKSDLAEFREEGNSGRIAEYEFYVDRYRNERNNFIWMGIGTVCCRRAMRMLILISGHLKETSSKKGTAYL
jgi:hypothetical protein